MNHLNLILRQNLAPIHPSHLKSPSEKQTAVPDIGAAALDL